LGDFALALDLHHLPTETTPSGTPCTAAPEQLATDPSFLSAQTDQHGLAILAYRLLGAKNNPFTDWTFYLSHQHPNQTPVRNPLINPEAYAVISKGSSFYPQDRYSSCEEFAIALSKAHGMI